jgi:hypothetical protein
VRDSDGDPASLATPVAIGERIVFADDGPRLTQVAAGAGVTLDETTAVTSFPFGFPISATSANSAIRATTAFGADGPAASGALSYSLAIASIGGATPLRTAVGDHAISLEQIGPSTIAGRYDDGAVRTAFTVAIGATGRLTVTQFVPLEHTLDGSSPQAYDDPLTLTGPGGASLISAVLTLTDGDGDTASASVGIGASIRFEDDGPLLDLSVVASPALLAGMDPGSSPGVIGFAQGTLFTISAASAGADGEASRQFVLAVGSGPSGLIDAQTGEHVAVALVGGVVEGRTAATQQRVFILAIDAQTGETALHQFRSVRQDGDPVTDENGTVTARLNDGVVSLAGTLTDNDGDTSTSTVDISTLIRFEHDGPAGPAIAGLIFDSTLSDTLLAAAPLDRRAAELVAATVAAGTLLAASDAFVPDAPEALAVVALTGIEPVETASLQRLPASSEFVVEATNLFDDAPALSLSNPPDRLAPVDETAAPTIAEDAGHDAPAPLPATDDSVPDLAAGADAAPAFDPAMDGSSMMLALLAAAQNGENGGNEAAPPEPASVQAAIADVTQAHLVASVIDQFAGGAPGSVDEGGNQGAGEGEGAGQGMLSVLFASVGGSGDTLLMHPEAMHPADDLNAMALAVA